MISKEHVAPQLLHQHTDPDIRRGAHYEVVKCKDDDQRDWLKNAPICPAMSEYEMAHVGIMQAKYPFFIERPVQPGTYMMACHQGRGEILVDGKWELMTAGQACLLPPHIYNAFACIKGHEWGFTWVRYNEGKKPLPIVSDNSPVIANYDDRALALAIRGLLWETENRKDTARCSYWLALIHSYVMDMAKPHQADERLHVLWKYVGKNLAKPWTLGMMAESIHVSSEHLRRLCRKDLGRSPMQQLAYMRIKHAQELLTKTNDKLEVVSQLCGYASSYTFSNIFTKWVGCRPSDYRKESWK